MKSQDILDYLAEPQEPWTPSEKMGVLLTLATVLITVGLVVAMVVAG